METVKRGYVPKDTVEFGPKAAAKLNAAAQELAFLLDRGYDTKSASTFVGNHHLLSERQRLALALMNHPDFLILDEPTRGIDIGTKTEIQKLVLKLAGEGKSLIFISSEIEEMLRTCTKMAVLRDGAKVGEITESLTQESVMKAIAGGGGNE